MTQRINAKEHNFTIQEKKNGCYFPEASLFEVNKLCGIGSLYRHIYLAILIVILVSVRTTLVTQENCYEKFHVGTIFSLLNYTRQLYQLDQWC